MIDDYRKKLSIPYKPIVLIVLDGFGVSPLRAETTWRYAKRQTMEELEKYYPFTTLQASGIAVGLMWNEEGNSEVGHLAMGTGRVVYNHLPRILVSIQDETFFSNPALKKAAEHTRANFSSLHFIGLFSSGSVHAYKDHLYALLDFAKREGNERVFLHLFTDGRDAPTTESASMIAELQQRIDAEYPFARIASLIGRRFAMDRDAYWDRVEKAYMLFTNGTGTPFHDAVSYLKSQHEAGITDEFIEPACLAAEDDKIPGRIREGDAVVFFNFREDSVRELVSAFTLKGFDKFARVALPNVLFVTFTRYDARFPVEVAFPPIEITRPLAAVIAEAGKKQLHVAETEKYAHVTYFFNGGVEKPYPGEDRRLIPSLKGISFEERPEMSADGVTDAVLEGINEKYDFILVNFANGDMVGHTGDFKATVTAIEVLDFSIGKIIPAVLEKGGAVIITGDHGNAEEKIYPTTGEKKTKHTSNPVPFFLIAKETRSDTPRPPLEIKKLYANVSGIISDVAPTILELMGLDQPNEMTGVSLLPKLL